MLAHNLRRYRALRGLSQEELAHRADIDRTYISSLERSQYAAGIDVLERLALALGIAPYELLRPAEEVGDGEGRYVGDLSGTPD
ncbi:MAG TPA: helix-turn-helix transcriptional regulator [Sphingomonadaceae bacterium]|nr:helix-turn-helix transcriptional regulator [Sphingomonadaceae bacterium]